MDLRIVPKKYRPDIWKTSDQLLRFGIRLPQAGSRGAYCRFGPARKAELSKDVANMIACRMFANDEPFGDLSIR